MYSESSGYFTPSVSLVPALNLTTFLAGIWMVSPDWGLRPSRAARSETEKVPKPTKVTLSPAFIASAIASEYTGHHLLGSSFAQGTFTCYLLHQLAFVHTLFLLSGTGYFEITAFPDE